MAFTMIIAMAVGLAIVALIVLAIVAIATGRKPRE